MAVKSKTKLKQHQWKPRKKYINKQTTFKGLSCFEKKSQMKN